MSLGTSLSKNYLHQLERKLTEWYLAKEVVVLRKKLLAEVDAGYLRLRVQLLNDDLLEISEYVSAGTSELMKVT